MCMCASLQMKFWNTFNLCTPEFAHSCVVVTALLFRLNKKGRPSVYLVTYYSIVCSELTFLLFVVYFLDGRQSFIFSSDDDHRPIHGEALLHYFDPDKKEKIFVAKEKY